MELKLVEFDKEKLKLPEIIQRREIGVEILAELIKSKKLPENLANANKEVLEWLALTFEHPEREEEIFSLIQKYKEFVQDPRQLQGQLLELLNQEKKDVAENNLEISLGKELFSIRIEKIIDYFNPKQLLSLFKKVIVIKSDNIVSEQSGFSVNINGELLIFSHSKNLDNFDHEFMHGFINPIVEKLGKKLSEAQKNRIIELASEKYKNLGDYGEDWFSLLVEEIIRVYNIYIKKEEKFSETGDNKLRTLVYSLYRQYEHEKKESKLFNFEDFLIENLPGRL